jgi:ferric-dicitrate binding protein FerR (iron transport regulator)
MNQQVTLPDGSIIFLNRNTKISYKSDFEKRGRQVSIEGEAFFEITTDPSNPFTVNAGDATISVLGTSFNVIARNDESLVEVFVNTGKVRLESGSGSQNLIVDPGYVATINSDLSEKKLNTNPNYISWKTGKLIYEGQSLDVVFNDLKNIYNVDIIATDPDILNQPITTVFDNEPIETKIRIICVTFNLSYQKDGNIYRLEKK